MGERREGKGICMIMADFHCCMAEINTALIFFFFFEKQLFLCKFLRLWSLLLPYPYFT